MKNKNIVRDKNKKTPFYKDKRGILALVLILLMFLLTAITMPMSQIPILGRMGSIFGLTDESMRALTLSDFAAYTFGVEGGGRLASVRNAQYSVYDNSGGLSPFAKQSADRLLDAKQAYLKEFDKTGKWNAVYGSASGRDDIADPEGIGMGSSYYGSNAVAPSIDANTNAAAEGAYGQPFVPDGQDIALEEAYADSSVTEIDENGKMVLRTSSRVNMILPRGSGGALKSARSDPDTMYFQALDDKSKKIKVGRLGAFGGLNARVARVGTNIGPGGGLRYFGASGADMGRVYYLSSTAKSQKYNDVAKNVVEAAWDGGVVETEDMVAVGEQSEKVVDSVEKAPSTIISKANTSRSACAYARARYDQAFREQGEKFKKMRAELQRIGEDSGSGTGVPGSCVHSWGIPKKNRAKRKKSMETRAQWNAQIDAMITMCKELRNTGENYAGQCGMNYKQDVGCGDLEKAKAGTISVWQSFWDGKKCWKASLTADGEDNLKWEDGENNVKGTLADVTSGAGLDGSDPTNENFF